MRYPIFTFLLFLNPLIAISEVLKVASLSLFSDEILLDFFSNEPSIEIVALSPLVDDPQYSSVVNKAKKISGRVSQSVESLLKLKADLVFSSTYNHPQWKANLKASGLRIVEVPKVESYDELKSNIALIAKELNLIKKGEFILQKNFRRTEVILPTNIKLLNWNEDGLLIGSNTLWNDLLSSLKLDNLAHLYGVSGFQKATQEIFLKLNPDFLVVPCNCQNEDEEDVLWNAKIKVNPLYKHMKAVKEKKLIFIKPNYFYAATHYIEFSRRIIAAKLRKERAH